MPLHNVISDDRVTFVCCGLHKEQDSNNDPYRFCFKSETTDSMYDYDEIDLFDTIEVMSRALSTVKRMGE